MPAIDVVDSTWICARPAAVAAVVAQPSNWRRWWPDLVLDVDEWRGDKGVRWTVRAPKDRAAGTMEVWIEPADDGVVVHYFLRMDPVAGRLSARRAASVVDARRRRVKQVFWALGDQLDPGRLARVASPDRAE
ncbi:MAG TPA: polyketide cyclase / dehydrase and lipid transport [Jatrophihabitantaceae bacterium]|nr:polyketide cyclase / dehydrase and lipid transport [Jatrophihabitantaceae bacterium]